MKLIRVLALYIMPILTGVGVWLALALFLGLLGCIVAEHQHTLPARLGGGTSGGVVNAIGNSIFGEIVGLVATAVVGGTAGDFMHRFTRKFFPPTFIDKDGDGVPDVAINPAPDLGLAVQPPVATPPKT